MENQGLWVQIWWHELVFLLLHNYESGKDCNKRHSEESHEQWKGQLGTLEMQKVDSGRTYSLTVGGWHRPCFWIQPSDRGWARETHSSYRTRNSPEYQAILAALGKEIGLELWIISGQGQGLSFLLRLLISLPTRRQQASHWLQHKRSMTRSTRLRKPFSPRSQRLLFPP